MKTLPFLLLFITTAALAAPPLQRSVTPVLGPKVFLDGDVIEILDVISTSPKLEQGDRVTVKGRVRLDSREAADLCFFLTQTKGDGREEVDPSQRIEIKRGLQDFHLEMTIKHQGVLHLSLYESRQGRPIGAAYFGTEAQMAEIAAWDLSYVGK